MRISGNISNGCPNTHAIAMEATSTSRGSSMSVELLKFWIPNKVNAETRHTVTDVDVMVVWPCTQSNQRKTGAMGHDRTSRSRETRHREIIDN